MKIEQMKEEVWRRLQRYEKERKLIELQNDIRQRRTKLLMERENNGICNVLPPCIDWGILDITKNKGYDKRAPTGAKQNRVAIGKAAQEMAKSVRRYATNAFSRQKDDPEEIKMMTIIRKAMQKQNRKIKAVCDLQFTVGIEETDEFASRNLKQQGKGRPFFERVKRGLGVNDQIILWVLKGNDHDNFITEILPASMTHGHDKFIHGHKMDLSLIAHKNMKASKTHEPSMGIWYSTDQSQQRIISDVDISYTRDDERELSKERYVMLAIDLSDLGLASAHFHIRYTDRPVLPKLTDTFHMDKELHDYEVMLAQNPNDPILKRMVDEMQRRFRVHQLEEEARTRCTPVDPLIYTVEFLALDPKDVVNLRNIYINIFDGNGNDDDSCISVEEFALFLHEPHTMLSFIRHIFFVSNDAVPLDGKLSFGITMKGVATFCMLNANDILQFTFSLCDTTGRGNISNTDFLALVSAFHPQHRGRAMRALREFDLQEEGQMRFSQFKSLHETFPHLLYPAFHFQVSWLLIIFVDVALFS